MLVAVSMHANLSKVIASRSEPVGGRLERSYMLQAWPG